VTRDYDRLRLDEMGSIAAFLHELADEQWDAASLCDGWRVRDVVSHIVAGFLGGLISGIGGAISSFPNDIDLGRIFRETHRTALSTDVEWKPNDFLTFNADYTRSKYDRDENRDYNTYFLDGGVAGALPGVFQPGGITVQNGAVTGLNYANYKPPAGGAGLHLLCGHGR